MSAVAKAFHTPMSSATNVLGGLAAAVHGAVFGVVKAAVDRAGATGYRAITHESPK
ncbi:DUF4235 domain-containing protein [Rhodococcus sp. 1R11]|uniref:DUF4235 domain-containing protein n=1 Tax=Rhodococcus sp. 1R11 TaxID=2559614 RepID=UPI001071A4B8|nr:DUF4235 domain-containing protein [Rhodococcus sp. 1R11]TFI43006.1 DUF4235 domain-containing protein [Rhodococcus sp. 1R11]